MTISEKATLGGTLSGGPRTRYHRDGSNWDEIVIPSRFPFDTTGRTINLTRIEVGGAVTGAMRGPDVFGRGSLRDQNDCGWAEAVEAAIILRNMTDELPSIDTVAIDIEGGFHPWADHADEVYKQGMDDFEYETRARGVMLKGLDAGRSLELPIGYWGRPKSWESPALSDRISDVYAMTTALHPSLYIRYSGNSRLIQNFGHRMQVKCGYIRAQLGIRPTVVAWLWDHNAANDHLAQRALATDADMRVAHDSAKWADQRVYWFAASSSQEAATINEQFEEGNRLDTFFRWVFGMDAATPVTGVDPNGAGKVVAS